jgi:hypothetical protein
VVLVAASGGGTRAALYAASVFRGLDRLGALADVQLCSGVSGGSTGIAHLAIHRGELLKDRSKSWQRYADVMSAPFIDDVLCGTLEPRIALGTRMGRLLDESFYRHMYRSEKTSLTNGKKLKDAEIGVIFNTTLAGTELTGESPDPTQAGSRLIVTNLQTGANTFPAEEKQFPELKTEYLHYVIVNDPDVPLTTGAAVSANFPPVFPNALVVKKANGGMDRYWVTDGGAAENRGAISLLYVLRNALNEEAKKDKADRRTPLPVHIVVAEASAVSLDFKDDRGLGSTLGASEKFASQVALELLKQIQEVYCNTLNGARLDVHFLPMPLVLRSRGGIGTHWKLPAYVKIANPLNKDDSLILSEKQTRDFIMDLYLPEGKRHMDTAKGKEKELLDKAWSWIEGTGAPDRYGQHRKNWTRLEETFATMGYTPKGQ